MRYDAGVARAVSRSLVAIVLTAAVAAGYEPTLNRQAIEEAIAIGQSRLDSTRARYHQPYRIHVGRPPVDYIDVVTPFRRLELAVEEQSRAGNRLFRQQDALAVLAVHGDRLNVVIEFTFHPLNSYVGVPPYMVTLARADAPGRIDALEIQRIPRFGARIDGTHLPYPSAPVIPSGGQPMLGGTLIVSFGGGRLEPRGTYDIVIEESGKELARERVDLGNLR